ncbi:hypothetical protein GUITHDRAFT_152397 [Guillardia theta CCMP2712]|uniref:3-hydroxyisobutyrate dehydrogenase n=1 Tax=Guillardia theta (strain CCMP2712) TaxID=905079 RepID=L1JEH5_GUITC|nr:hypothetical protein GUITHDRAFT_152397 [Guillardia theta CCMP2712]EKX46539.1 hypothetical protein GUITHDRAFT_152397 [Guillardia theta CCMP2712]|mmetsp:Transcript_48041/g.150768  ORF Transcript_48041/g.150768 Transcript_48041/m.150768 type:complete len:283 (-) Transcript_48041:2493-3341(-)|eukprot:XP_005833519.1 hypothetical protein GUITHDRAFT_152397 [Guillardia theta CCMP2712]
MASNLLKSKYQVNVFDLNVDAVHELCKQGATSVSCPAELAGSADTVITMLPSSRHVKEVYCGNEGLLASRRRGVLYIDCSTIESNYASELSAVCYSSGHEFIDAPVSGGTGGAQNATLTFMVGGEERALERARPLLSAMGKNIIHCGKSGNGQAAKICNNLILGISMSAVSEAFNLGRQMGIDPHVLASVVNSSSGRCWSSETYNPCPGVMEGVPSSRGYTGGFASDLMLKDLLLALQAAADTKMPLPIGSAVAQVYTVMHNKGYGEKDFSSIFEFLSKNKS